MVVIAANAHDCERLAQEINFFEPSIKPQVLPDWETLPYDTISPHQIWCRCDWTRCRRSGRISADFF